MRGSRLKTIRTAAGLAVGALFSATAHAYEAGAVSDGGRITGTLSFTGSAPAPKALPITKDNTVCGSGNREIIEVNVTGGKLAGAVVHIVKIDKGKAWGEVAAPMLDQKGCAFAPEVLVVRKDADLTIRNSDPVLHNVHTYEVIGKVRRTMFNVGQPDKGDIKQPIKVRRANAIKVECDAHDFMHGWAFAADNPYAVVSAADGSFSITDVPAGEYELKAWHPVLGEQSARVTVKAGEAVSVPFAFSM